MCAFARRSAAVLFLLLLVPAAAFAQAAITGVVKDASGAVLPGVTVEAASPVLIERVRSVVSDDTGQYRIVDLRTGHLLRDVLADRFQHGEARRHRAERHVRRDGQRRPESRRRSHETITVTGETPIVDVQSAKVQTTMSRDVIASIPTSRNATGIMGIIPGMATTGDSGGITGGTGGGASSMHGGRPSDSRTLSDGLNMGLGRRELERGRRERRRLAGNRDEHVGRPGRGGNRRRRPQRRPARRRQYVQRHLSNIPAPTAACRAATTPRRLKDAGLRSPSELIKVWEVNPMGGGTNRPRQACGST